MKRRFCYIFLLYFLSFLEGYTQSSSCDLPPPPPCPGGNCGSQGPGGAGGGGASAATNGEGAFDPNLILSPLGFSTPRWVSVKDNMGFAIYFENDPNLATAPAHNVYIYYRFNAHQDPRTFRLGSFGFNGMNFQVPDDVNFYQKRLDLRDSLGLYVDITAGINIVTNTAFWIFQSIDPLTNQPPIAVLSGFLPVKDTSAAGQADTAAVKGEGFVKYSIKPFASTQTRDSIFATAQIVFDSNDSIPTNIEFNTVDAVAPTSKINLATVSGNIISLFWSGVDDANGSGVKDYSLYVSQDGGPFVFYKQFTGLTTDFIGAPGSTYCFFVRARDNVDNLEPALKNICEVSVNLGGSGLPLTWLYFKGQEKAPDAELSWATGSEINTAYFIVERSLDGRTFQQIGKVSAAGNSSQSNNYGFTDKNALALNTQKIFYRLRQVDKDGKFTYTNTITIAVRGSNEQVIKIYPNPFSKNLTLLIITAKKPSAEDLMELYSLNGTLLYKQSLSARQNNTPIVLNGLPALAAGTYIMHTNLNGTDNAIKIIKQ